MFIPSFCISGSTNNYSIMPRRKGALEFSDYQPGYIIGLYKGGLSQRKISENLSIPLFTLNRLIIEFNRETKECTVSRSGRPGPSDRTQGQVKRNVENNPRFKASEIAKNVDVSTRTVVWYLH